MRIVDLLKKESIELNSPVKSKDEAIDKLIALQTAGGAIADSEEYKSDILKREAISTTAIGEGIAIPHAKSTAVLSPSLAAITSQDGVDYGSPDGKPSKLIFMIAAPVGGSDVHLEVLSRMMTLLMDEGLRESLKRQTIKKNFLIL